MSIDKRIATVRNVLANNGWDAILVTNPSNRRYLTGFTAEDHAADESAGVLVVTRDTAELYVSPTNLPWAAAEVPEAAAQVIAWSESWIASGAALVDATGAEALAVEDTSTTAASWFALQEAVAPNVRIIRAGEAIDLLRAIKSKQEVALLAEASRCTDAAFLHTISQLKPGLTERQAADLVRDALRHSGSDGEAFDTIVATGPNAAKPHHRPGSRVLAEGEPIIIDMGARIDGYNGDLTRTVCLGKPGERLVTIYEAVLAAQTAGLNAIRAGTQASAPNLATRQVFREHEFEQYVIHSAGHGLGLRVHEAPTVNKRSTGVLASGHVVTMEPGLYLPDWGGVRIEDVAVVEHGGHRNLTTAPKGVDSMCL